MDVFNVRDLKERPSAIVHRAEKGLLSLVTKRGHPVFFGRPIFRNHAPNRPQQIFSSFSFKRTPCNTSPSFQTRRAFFRRDDDACIIFKD